MVDKWYKNEGDVFKSGERLCEVSLDGLTVAVDGPDNGYLAHIVVRQDKLVPVGTIIAHYTESLDAFLSYREELRKSNHDAENVAVAKEVIDEMKKKPDNKILLRELKNLMKDGDIDESSGM